MRPPGLLFAQFSDDEFAAVSLACDRRSFRAGDVLVELGDPAPGLNIILDGEVTIERPDPSGGPIVYDVSTRGDLVGEASLFDGRPATATVRAINGVETLRLSPQAYRDLCGRNDPFAHVIERIALLTMAKRLRRIDDLVVAQSPGSRSPWGSPVPKGVLDRILDWSRRPVTGASDPPVIERHATEILYSSRMFREVPVEVRDTIAGRLTREVARRGAFVCVQGELSDRMYLLGSGAVEVFISLDQTGNRVHRLGQILPGDVFGMTALVDGRPRMATCVVAENAQLLRLDRGNFYEFVNERTAAGRAVRRAVLTAFASQISNAAVNVAALAGDTDLMALAASLESA